VLHMLGFINAGKGNADEARKYYLAALDITPRFVESMVHLGFLEAQLGKMDESQKWYEKALKEDPESPRTQTGYADLYYLKKEYGKALEFYRKALEVKPNFFNAIVLAGGCAQRTGDAEAAASYYRRAEQLRPDSWLPPYNMGCLLATHGKTDEAIDCLRRSVDKDTGTCALAHFFDTDEDLVSLRNLPAFAELKARVDGRGGDQNAGKQQSKDADS